MDQNPDDLLTFKDFSSSGSPAPAQISVNSPQKHASERGRDPLQELIYDMSESAKVLGGDNSPQKSTNTDGNESDQAKGISFLTIEYYQQFFNVDTYMVLDRIASAMIPKRAPRDYLKSHIGSSPDLYGPFWISVTLIFSIAISGNIANYLQTASDTYHWRYNFRMVSYAASSIFLYSCILPGALWALLKYSLKPIDEDLESENATYTPSLLSLMCIYGYSLVIYIPVSILWVIQISILQWLLALTAAFASGSVLIAILTPALRNSKISLFLIIGILAAHFLLAAGFMLYFFHDPNASAPVVGPVVKATTAAAAAALKNMTH